ncbi:MAG: hypothetical protein ACLGH3_03340 [Actinomycetota bacterium]
MNRILALVTILTLAATGTPAFAQTDTTTPQATIAVGSSPVADPIITFSEPVGPVSGDAIAWTVDDTPILHRRACFTVKDAATPCSGSLVARVRLSGYAPLPIGGTSTVAVNGGSSQAQDGAGNAVVPTSKDRRITAAQEERGPAVAASWLRFTTPAAMGGSFRAEKAADMVATYRFSGDQITWVTRTGPKDGIASLSVDGRSLGLVDNSAATQRFGVERTYSGFGAGPHLLVIRVTGLAGRDGRGPWVVIEGFRSALGEAGDGVATYRWSNEAWRTASGKRVSRSATKGAEIRLTFWGGGIDWWAAVGPQEGIAEVLVDGKRYRSVDNSAASPGIVRRRVAGLDAGIHVLKIRVTGRPGADDRGRKVSVDRFSVRPSVTMFKGFGAWVDLFDYDASTTESTISGMLDKMKRYGVKTLYLQTARFNSDSAFLYPAKIVYWLSQAKARGIKVVGWYFTAYGEYQDLDVARSIAVANYRSPRGDRFDGVGIDIEVQPRGRESITTDMVDHLRRVRAGIGVTYPMSAIVPPPNQMELAPGSWAGFPWVGIGRYSDAIQPMAYSSYRKGSQCPSQPKYCTLGYTRNAITTTREKIGTSEPVIHVIGGIANRLTDQETRDFVEGAKGAYGASFYDYRTTSDAKWEILSHI